MQSSRLVLSVCKHNYTSKKVLVNILGILKKFTITRLSTILQFLSCWVCKLKEFPNAEQFHMQSFSLVGVQT